MQKNAKKLTSAVVGLMAMGLLGSTAHAQVFFGEDINTTATGQNENAVRIAHPNADAARTAFLSNLQGVATENFEGFAANATATTLTFGPDTATLSPGLTVVNIPAGTLNGVYPISGNQTLLQAVGAANTFRIDFSTPQAAFGFYITDLEIVGNLSLQFLLADNVSTITRPVPTLAGTGGANNTGSVAYFGVIDTASPFIAVSFNRTLNSNDGFAFDDMTIGRANQVVLPAAAPEPGASALLVTGLLPFIGVAVCRRKA